MKKLVTTITLAIALLGVSANAAPELNYTPEDLGGGMFKYTFNLDGNDGLEKSLATENLVFSGKGGAQIQQIAAFGGFVPVNDKTTAETYHVNPGALYDMELDTWLYDGWSGISPDNTNVGAATGDDVVLSVGSGTQTYYTEKLLIQIVADGNIDWTGKISRDGVKYDTSGSTVGAGPGPGASQGNPHMPEAGNTHIVDDPRVPGGTTTRFGFHGDFQGGAWFDPPLVPAFEYELTSGHNFTALALPVDIAGNTTGNVYEVRIPNFSYFMDADDGPKTFAEMFGAAGAGIQKFWVKGIDVPVDSADPVAFPTFLQFDNVAGDPVTFSMTGVPEPTTMGLMLFGAIGMFARKRRRG